MDTIINKVLPNNTLKFGNVQLLNPVFELQIRIKDINFLTKDMLISIYEKIVDGERCGYGSNFIWEVVQKENKDGKR